MSTDTIMELAMLTIAALLGISLCAIRIMKLQKKYRIIYGKCLSYEKETNPNLGTQYYTTYEYYDNDICCQGCGYADFKPKVGKVYKIFVSDIEKEKIVPYHDLIVMIIAIIEIIIIAVYAYIHAFLA